MAGPGSAQVGSSSSLNHAAKADSSELPVAMVQKSLVGCRAHAYSILSTDYAVGKSTSKTEWPSRSRFGYSRATIQGYPSYLSTPAIAVLIT